MTNAKATEEVLIDAIKAIRNRMIDESARLASWRIQPAAHLRDEILDLCDDTLAKVRRMKEAAAVDARDITHG